MGSILGITSIVFGGVILVISLNVEIYAETRNARARLWNTTKNGGVTPPELARKMEEDDKLRELALLWSGIGIILIVAPFVIGFFLYK